MCRFIFVLFVIPVALDIQAGDFAGGDGSPESPWQIAEPEHLDNIRHHLSDHFELAGDIELSGTVYSQGSGWMPIGACDYGAGGNCAEPGFTGSLDGNTHTIHGLHIDRERDDVGLFGALQSGAVVTDLNLTGVNITVGVDGNNYVGVLAAVAVDSEIFNVSADGVVAGFSMAGGLIGQMTGGFGQDLYAAVDVSGQYNVGGLIGVINDGAFPDETRINRVSAEGQITGRMSVGGLVGTTFSGTKITRASAQGLVSSTNGQSGGLVGAMMQSEAKFVRAEGDVESLQNIGGGLVGWMNNSIISNCYATGAVRADNSAGGLVGFQEGGSVSNCYAIGEVGYLGEDGNAIGGLIGGRTSGSVEDSFWDIVASGMDESAGGTGVTTADMLTIETFTDAGWDFDDAPVWSTGLSGQGRSCPWLTEVAPFPPPCDEVFSASFSDAEN